MIAISFGALCFNVSASEQSILIVVASKSEFPSLDDFLAGALNFLESDSEFCDNWNEIYKDRNCLPASDDDITQMRSTISEMNQRVSILFEPIIKAVNVLPPKWNDISLGLETKNEYVLYLWGTSA